MWAYEINIGFVTSETKLLVLVLHEEFWSDFRPLKGLRLWLEVAGYFLVGIFFISVTQDLQVERFMQRFSFFIQAERCRYFCQCRHSQDRN